MGATCLGEPRKRGDLMKRKDDPQVRYQSVPHRLTKGQGAVSAVAGEAQGNKLKIKLNLITCSVCMQSYNITTRQPQIVCSNNHTYCKQCTVQFMNTNKRCPECRAQMRTPLIRNRDIYQLVQDNQQLIEQNKLQPIKEEVVPVQNQVKLTVDYKNKCINSFWVKDNRVMKIQNDRTWEGFMSNEVLPLDKESCFTVKICYSKCNNIQLGIVGKGYKIEPNVTCSEAIVYHLADGRILEGTKGQGSEWKGQGSKFSTSNDSSTIITVKVDPITHKVTWIQGEKLLGTGRFPEFLKNRQFVAYILLCHKEDVIVFNP